MKSYNYLSGLSNMQIPSGEREKILKFLKKGKVPSFVLDTIAENNERVSNLHPDYYPWKETNFDRVFDGLNEENINSEKVWKYVVTYFANKNNMGALSGCGIDMGENSALVNLLEKYALAKYYGTGALKIK